jgi:hypothetical protein
MPQRIATTIALAVLLFAAAAAEAQGKTFTARLDVKSIVVEGVQPRQEVLLFGVSLEPRGFANATRRWNRIGTDDDGDGTVTFAFDKPIEFRSVFAVVDLRGGDYVVLKPDGYDQLVPRALDPAALRRGEKAGEVAGLDLAGPMAYIVVVRGGAGAWGMAAHQNGHNDDDHASPVLRVDPAKLTALAGHAPPPAVLTPGDVILVVNPIEMEFFSTRVTR